MKKSLQNTLTTILGFIIILAGAASLFIKASQEVMTPLYYVITFAIGFILIYVKNEKAVELTKNLIDKLK